MRKLLYKIRLFFRRKSKTMYIDPSFKLKYSTIEEGTFHVLGVAKFEWQQGIKIYESLHFIGKKVKA